MNWCRLVDNISAASKPAKPNILRFLTAILAQIIFSSICCADSGERPPIRIGAIYGFTGFANVWSQQARRGIELATEDINSAGGINGRKLEVIFEDSGTTANGALTAFNKLMKVDRVRAVIGDIISFVTLPLVPIAQQNKVILVTPSIFDSDMPANSDFFFTTCPSKQSILAPVNRFFDLNPKIRTVAIICADNTWGLTYLDIWKSAAKVHDIKVLDENCIDEYASDMRAEILRAKSKNPDALIIAFGIDRALKRMKEINFSPKVLTTSDLDEAIHSRGLPAQDAIGVYFIDWLASDDFRKRFQARFNQPPIMAPQGSYEAVRVIAEAYRIDERDLPAAVSRLRYAGVSGPIDFTGSHAGNQGNATLMVVSDKGIQIAN